MFKLNVFISCTVVNFLSEYLYCTMCYGLATNQDFKLWLKVGLKLTVSINCITLTLYYTALLHCTEQTRYSSPTSLPSLAAKWQAVFTGVSQWPHIGNTA